MNVEIVAGVAEASAEMNEVVLRVEDASLQLQAWKVTPATSYCRIVGINGTSISAVSPDFEKVGG